MEGSDQFTTWKITFDIHWRHDLTCFRILLDVAVEKTRPLSKVVEVRLDPLFNLPFRPWLVAVWAIRAKVRIRTSRCRLSYMAEFGEVHLDMNVFLYLKLWVCQNKLHVVVILL
jgi:hypothetical protein